ncbi:MAG: ABC transporter ATP-binding protein [candidate division Zixibacteria bacterium]|nr:ABC transporter ATP-binding protein [candidate division Zixibacteria bacterium]
MAEGFFEDEALGKAYDHRLMRRLLGYLRPYRLVVAVALVLLFIMSGLQIAGPWIIKKVIDGPIAQHDLAGLSFWVGLYAVILIGQFAIQFANMVMTQWIGQKAMLDMRTQLFDHILTLDMRFFDKNPVGRLLTRVTGDVNALNELFASGVVTIFGDIFTLIAIVGAMVYLNAQMALVTFLVLPLLFAATWVFRRKVRGAYREVRRLVAKINAFWQERVTGIAVVQGFNREDQTFAQHQELNAELRAANLRSVFHYAVFFPVVELIGAISLALIIWFGGGKVVTGVMTFGALAAFIQYAERFYQPIRDLAEKYNILQGAMASSERVFKLLDTQPAIPLPEQPYTGAADMESAASRPTGSRAEGGVVFDHVWFAYQNEDWVLEDVSFSVAPGETVALVGATGAGKTSIANLITRLYEFQRGSITVDGIDVRAWNASALRRRVGAISQDVFLFSGRIADNIRLDSPTLNDEALLAAAERVGLGRLSGGSDHGLSRPVGERGSGLSVGEKQLVAFARALAFDPGILILDEATSSVDHETEARIQAALSVVFSGRTNIVIAHRLSTIRSADRIIVLHKGRVREVGRHDELVTQDGIYARLHRLQADTYEPDESSVSGRRVTV